MTIVMVVTFYIIVYAIFSPQLGQNLAFFDLTPRDVPQKAQNLGIFDGVCVSWRRPLAFADAGGGGGASFCCGD